jgi:hypothetical protein
MSISIRSWKNDIVYTLNSDVMVNIKEFAANEILLSRIIHKDTPLEKLATLPFYSQLVVDSCYSSISKRDKYIYNLLRRREYSSNIKNVEWAVCVDAPLSELLYNCIGLKNLKYLKFRVNQPLGDSLHGLSSLTHLTLLGYFNQPLGDSMQVLSSLTHLTLGDKFNQPLRDSLQGLNLTHLSFEGNLFEKGFNQPLGGSLQGLSSLRRLELGNQFNQPLGDSLQGMSNLTHLTFKR